MARRRRFKKGNKPKTSKRIKKVVDKEIARFTEWKSQLTATAANAGVAAAQVPTVVTNLGVVALGTGQGARIGTQIRIMKWRIQYTCAASAGVPSVIRIIIVRDMQNDGVAGITMGDLFADTTALDAPNWLYNINNATGKGKNRYKILYDKAHIMNPQTAIVSDYKVVNVTKRYSKGVLVRYNNAANGDNRDIISGAVYMLVQTNLAANTPFMYYNYQIWYEDA